MPPSTSGGTPDATSSACNRLQIISAKVSFGQTVSALVFKSMKRRLAGKGFRFAALIAVILMAALLWETHAQFRGFGGRGRRGFRNPEEAKENEMMEKAINPDFKEDVFTFARLRFGAD